MERIFPVISVVLVSDQSLLTSSPPVQDCFVVRLKAQWASFLFIYCWHPVLLYDEAFSGSNDFLTVQQYFYCIDYMITWNTGSHLPNDTVSHPRTMDSSATLLCQPQLSHFIWCPACFDDWRCLHSTLFITHIWYCQRKLFHSYTLLKNVHACYRVKFKIHTGQSYRLSWQLSSVV
jgi:hypothetical protein